MTLKPTETPTSPPHTALRVVLFEGAGTRPFESERRFVLTEALLQAGYQVTRPTVDGHVSAPDTTTVVVLAQFEGSAPAFEGFEGARVEALDAAELAVEDVVERVAGFRAGQGLPAPGAWTPWFPVIDFQRCTNCMQCLSFCLFDVYGVDADGNIEVRNEDKCKTNCPACSRVCPDVAILFPKYKKGPINGDVVRDEDIQKESMKVDISALLGGDIYSSLRNRSTDFPPPLMMPSIGHFKPIDTGSAQVRPSSRLFRMIGSVNWSALPRKSVGAPP